ncbi:MAG: aldo/keto reductase [Verrucomicrobiia bacterium]
MSNSSDQLSECSSSREGRRAFLKRLAGLGAILSSGWVGSSALAGSGRDARHTPVLPLRALGRGGEAVTALCVGGAHVHSAMSRSEAERFLEEAMEVGVRFYDTAESYGNGESEKRFGDFLCRKHRDEIFLMTKTRANTAAEAGRHLEESLRRMRTDRLDLWQIHALDSREDVDNRLAGGVLDRLMKEKASGRVRYIGFTGHTRYTALLHLLKRLRELGAEMDTCQMPINVVDPSYESFVLHVLPELVNRGYGVLAMKTLVYGQLFGVRTSWNWARQESPAKVIGSTLSVEEALGFVWSLPVASLVSGMTNVDELRQNAALCRRTWAWTEAKRQAIIDRVANAAGPTMEFYKA